VGVAASGPPAAAPAGWSPALPAGLVLAGAVSVQTGAGIATRLFSQLPPAAVTALRLWPAALIMLAVGGRPAVRALAGLRARGHEGGGRRDAAITVAFGVALGFMNLAIYQAFARIPLGIAVTIEFLGPLAVTVAGAFSAGRTGAGRTRTLGYAALAAAGVVLLGNAAAAGINWAGVSAGGARMFRPSLLAQGAAIGLLSSVIPYWLELEALRRVPARLFGVWMSAQPAVAALIGLLLLSQRLSPAQWGGIGCVVVASAAASRG
jgi:inner membrane transporter RhtA